MHGRREAHHGRADPALGEGDHLLSHAVPAARRLGQLGAGLGPFGRHLPRRQPEQAGGDDQRPVRTGQHLTEQLHGAPVRGHGAGEVAGEGDVVLERQVDHAVRGGGGIAQDVEVVEAASAHLGAGGGEGGGRGVRAGQADDLVAGADQLGHQGGTNPTGRTGDENTHGKNSR